MGLGDGAGAGGLGSPPVLYDTVRMGAGGPPCSTVRSVGGWGAGLGSGVWGPPFYMIRSWGAGSRTMASFLLLVWKSFDLPIQSLDGTDICQVQPLVFILRSDSEIVMGDLAFGGDFFKSDRSWDDFGTSISGI